MGGPIAVFRSFSFFLFTTLNAFVFFNHSAQSVEPRTFGNSVRHEWKGVSVHTLRGSFNEVAQASGVLASPLSRKQGMLPYMTTYLDHLLKTSGRISESGTGIGDKVVKYMADYNYVDPLLQGLDLGTRAALNALSVGMSMEESAVQRAYVSPDSVYLMVSDQLLQEDFSRMSFTLGCATLYVPPSRSEDGHALIARTLEYPAMGKFENFASVYFVDQAQAKYRYVSLGTEGGGLVPVSGMNEKGLVVTLHSGFSFDSKGEGRVIFSILREILESAATLEEAQKICEKTGPANGWIVNLFEASNGKVRGGRLELDALNGKCLLKVENADEFYASTNHYVDEGLKKREIKFGPIIGADSIERKQRMQSLLKRYEKKIKPQDAMAVLADRYDPLQKRYMGYAPMGNLKIDQVSAVVFKPETLEMWISVGRAPVTDNADFVHFDWEELKNLESNRPWNPVLGGQKDFSMREVLRGTPNDRDQYPGFDFYLRAYFELTQNRNLAKALGALDRAIEQEPKEPYYRWARGLLRLKKGDLVLSAVDLEESTRIPGLDFRRIHMAQYYLGTIYDRLGKRAEALVYYELLVHEGSAYSKLKSAASRHLKRPARDADFESFGPDLKFGDTLFFP